MKKSNEKCSGKKCSGIYGKLYSKLVKDICDEAFLKTNSLSIFEEV